MTRETEFFGGASAQLERAVQCPAKYAQLFSMPLMGHISLSALCLLPNCKRYLASHLQEIPRNKDNIGRVFAESARCFLMAVRQLLC